MLVKLMRDLRARFRRSAPAAAAGPPPRPAGLLGRDWSAWRHTRLRGIPDELADEIAVSFGGGASAIYCRLYEATFGGGEIDREAWRRLGRDLRLYGEALRDSGRRTPRGTPSPGDLGRRPVTPPVRGAGMELYRDGERERRWLS